MGRIGSWIWDMLTDEEEWSDEQCRLFGYEPQSIRPTYETFKQALHPSDRDRVLAAVAATLERGAPYRVPCRIVRPRGEVIHVVCAGDVMRDEEGRPVRMAGTVAPVRRLVTLAGTEVDRVRQCAERNRCSPEEAVIHLLRQLIPLTP